MYGFVFDAVLRPQGFPFGSGPPVSQLGSLGALNVPNTLLPFVFFCVNAGFRLAPLGRNAGLLYKWPAEPPYADGEADGSTASTVDEGALRPDVCTLAVL